MRRLLVIALIMATPAQAWSAPPGWSGAGDMRAPRRAHSATLLSTGKVLVAGGDDGTRDLATAELYDWTTNSWSPARPLPQGRSGHSATRLPDGRVLVIGGSSGGVAQDGTFVYDPATDTWTAAAPLRVPHYVHSASLLRNGKVLVVAVYFIGVAAELYDPATDTWSAAGTPIGLESVMGFTSTVLPSGEVLVAGGFCNCVGRRPASLTAPEWPYSDAAQIYNPSTNTWSAVAPMSTAREGHAATLLPDGRVLVSGGGNSRGALATAEIYEPARRAWVPAAAMATSRVGHSAALLGNGRAMVAGGYSSFSGGLPVLMRTAETYDAAADAWRTVPGEMAAARYAPSATLLGSGQLLLTGGFDGGNYLASAEIYTLPTTLAVDSALDFGEGATRVVVVHNTGDSPLLVADVTATAGDFAVVEDGCSRRVISTTCAIRVRFAPAGPGTREASLRIRANTDPETSTVALTGTGPAIPAPTPILAPVGPLDADGDTVQDARDNCPSIVNRDQADRDGDAIGDACETLPPGDIPPVAGVSATATLVSGDVFVKLPPGRRLAQSSGFVPLKGVASIPVGSVVDARKGRVSLKTAGDFRSGGANRRLQAATFAAAMFRLRQARTQAQAGSAVPPTDLVLQTPPGLERACAARSGVRPIKGVVRALSASTEKGVFRAVGGASTTTVAGAASWVVEDRCTGTLTEVGRGRAAVRDRVLRRTVTVRSGRAYLARAKLFSARTKQPS